MLEATLALGLVVMVGLAVGLIMRKMFPGE
jgi:hypothetical protein